MKVILSLLFRLFRQKGLVLTFFCQRHGIRQLPLRGEKVLSDVSAVEPFKQELKYLNYTVLCFRMLPSKAVSALQTGFNAHSMQDSH